MLGPFRAYWTGPFARGAAFLTEKLRKVLLRCVICRVELL